MARKPVSTRTEHDADTATLEHGEAPMSLDAILDREQAEAAAGKQAALGELWRLAQKHSANPAGADGWLVLKLVGQAKLGNPRGVWHDWVSRARQREHLRPAATAFAALDRELEAKKIALRAARAAVHPARKALGLAEQAAARSRGGDAVAKAQATLKEAREAMIRAEAGEHNANHDFLETRSKWGVAVKSAQEYKALLPEGLD